jgi:hypothetical protein
MAKSGYVTLVRDLFEGGQKLTISGLKEKLPQFSRWELNSAVHYLTTKKELERIQVPRVSLVGKKEVWEYRKIPSA